MWSLRELYAENLAQNLQRCHMKNTSWHFSFWRWWVVHDTSKTNTLWWRFKVLMSRSIPGIVQYFLSQNLHKKACAVWCCASRCSVMWCGAVLMTNRPLESLFFVHMGPSDKLSLFRSTSSFGKVSFSNKLSLFLRLFIRHYAIPCSGREGICNPLLSVISTKGIPAPFSSTDFALIHSAHNMLI